jgi:hypothetical protein
MSNEDVTDNEVVEKTEESPSSREERFFGITTQITPRVGDDSPGEEEYKIEVIDPRKKEVQKPKKAEAASEDGDDSEVENYSARVRKRIDKLKYEFHEERRQREEAARLRDEAITYAQRIQEENKRLASIVETTQKAIQQQLIEKAKANSALAQADLKRAHEAGDADAIVKAQQQLTQAQLTEAAAPAYARKLAEYRAAETAKETVVQQLAAPTLQDMARNVPKPDPKASRWQRDNTWFGQDPEMTSFAYGVHQKLLQENGEDFASTDDYYKAIDNRMRQVFPDRFLEDDDSDDFYEESKPTRAATPKKLPVVAPAKRTSGSAPRKVQLTATQVALAKRLGLTPQQYASQVIKEMGNG